MKGTVTIELDELLRLLEVDKEVNKYKAAVDNWMKANEELADAFNKERLEIAQDIYDIMERTMEPYKYIGIVLNMDLRQLSLQTLQFQGKEYKLLAPKKLKN